MSASLLSIMRDPPRGARKQTNNVKSLFLSETEAAVKLGLHPVTLRRWRWEGRECPPFLRMGPKLVKYPMDELELWIEQVRAGKIQAGARNTEGAA